MGYVDRGVADVEPFPFPAIVGQYEMKLALILAVINPAIGGVLLLGPRGTAKTTAVRSLTDLLPLVQRSLCEQGCTEDMLDAGGLDAICDACAQKAGYGEPLTTTERVRIVNLPLNARMEDVVGGIDERLALEQQRVRLERGILAQADGHILYIDEVNMLDDVIANAILEAASQGYYTVRRGPQKLSYRSRFLLIGTMNPEEGSLRPQLLDRFGLRALVRGLQDKEQRFQVYEQAMWYRRDPDGMAAAFAEQTLALAEEIDAARALLERVQVTDQARDVALSLISEMGIDSSRAEITLFEAARAYAAADERDMVRVEDVATVATIALRFRRSLGVDDFLERQQAEDVELRAMLPAGNSVP
ncbi:MAG TPA: AAA family ATPase [Candidatus Binatia bacterium]|nr:AAA family ATPase [Candidatus Binatia bacterium]